MIEILTADREKALEIPSYRSIYYIRKQQTRTGNTKYAPVLNRTFIT